MDPSENFAAHFARLEKRVAAPAWLRDLRAGAMERFQKTGFPTLRDEEWKYTSVASLAETRFDAAADASGLEDAARTELVRWGLAGSEDFKGRLVAFVNGRFSTQLSTLGEQAKGIRIGSVGAAFSGGDCALLEGKLGGHLAFDKHPFALLNTALAEDGVFIYLPQKAVLNRPILVVFVSVPGAAPHVAHPRNAIVAGDGSQATIVEAYIEASHPHTPGTSGSRKYFTNAVTEVLLGAGARVEHYKLQLEGAGAYHIANVRAVQGRDSRFVSHSFSIGGALVRNDLASFLGAEGGECAMNGLYMATGKQHVDNHTLVDHAKPSCRSSEVYKGVLDGSARAVFNGKIMVRQDAQKTDARQSNKNLLLSKDAIIDTKPQLEIYADDVKCSHGAAVGQLDEDALFYLQSRGLPRDAARNLLTYAFASEVLHEMKLGPLRMNLEVMLHRWLGPKAATP